MLACVLQVEFVYLNFRTMWIVFNIVTEVAALSQEAKMAQLESGDMIDNSGKL